VVWGNCRRAPKLIRTHCITRELRSELARRTGNLVSHPKLV
jgi:hypothetical protein